MYNKYNSNRCPLEFYIKLKYVKTGIGLNYLIRYTTY